MHPRYTESNLAELLQHSAANPCVNRPIGFGQGDLNLGNVLRTRFADWEIAFDKLGF